MRNLFFAISICCSISLFAQDGSEADKKAIIGAIEAMFDGMRAGDSSMIGAVFADNIQMYTVFTTRKGEPVMKQDEPQKFLNAVGTPHDKVWDERIWSYDTKIDGRLANVWTEYTFYHGGELSHCGVNAFQLFNGENGWKIVNITDTRRRTKCQTDQTIAINKLMDDWHRAAAKADETIFFGSMSGDAIYIGTDATEHWTKEVFEKWSKKHFEKDSAWDFTPIERNVFYSKDGQVAWFDELLDTWMGKCRGSGVLEMTKEGWKLKHYHLAIAVPNEKVKGYLKLLKKKK